jgi:hypothetical protein
LCCDVVENGMPWRDVVCYVNKIVGKLWLFGGGLMAKYRGTRSAHDAVLAFGIRLFAVALPRPRWKRK